ncbi:TetR family transcriptional regulator [Kitasatospora cheerisanensis]|uniref:Transcriptional regulator n=1 Tax=Kitasatospora cheerisanensis KCTC 2395 TaxID=1348663 RepID=A0A066Z0N2_9ACTN|nr:TetR family transcriptional regulator [Kitasatospora cheerisanensis]KDN85799.1 transcriptional regulator [Kitasatospora cheerisanensis KCTC 2395]
MTETPAPAPRSRQAQKQASRRALLDAALALLERQNLSGLGVREVTRAAGLSPAGFYRHFADLAELGVVLVQESLANLHEMVRAVFAGSGDPEQLIDRSVEVIDAHVAEHAAYIRFLARERHGGVKPVRDAVGAELRHFAEELAELLALRPELAGWSAGDRRMLAELYVDRMVTTALALVEADPAERAAIADTVRTQLRLINLGSRHWKAS